MKSTQFRDLADRACDITESSLATDSAIRVGVSNARMHLNRKGAKLIVKQLKKWLKETKPIKAPPLPTPHKANYAVLYKGGWYVCIKSSNVGWGTGNEIGECWIINATSAYLCGCGQEEKVIELK